MKTIFSLLSSTALFLTLISCADTNKKGADLEWTYLLNGKDLSAFVQRNGEASFELIDSVLVGTAVLNTPNSFLCTKTSFGNFILELEFKVDSNFNSGVQFRSVSDSNYQNGRVHGYQLEFDPSERAYTGGIYDEARMGWLYPLNGEGNEAARAAFRQGEWNHLRLVAVDSSIRTWINEVPVANLLDETNRDGFIAFQVHSIKDSSQIGRQVMWKGIRIAPLQHNMDYPTSAPEKSYLVNKLSAQEEAEGWKLLFDGTSSNGWRGAYAETFPARGWEIKDGILTVLSSDGAESQNGGDIVTIDEYTEFDLRLQFKITPGANSGVKYYVTEAETNNPGSAIGLEFQILDDDIHPDAKLGNHEGSRTLGSLYDLIKAENKRRNSIGTWNNLRIISKGSHVEHWLNGFKVLEYERGSEAFRKLVAESKYKIWPAFGEAPSGHILLQDHGNEVSFRSIMIRDLGTVKE